MLTQEIGVLVIATIDLGLPQTRMDYNITNDIVNSGLISGTGAGTFVKKYYRPDDLRAIKRIHTKARELVEQYTQPWDKCHRLLYHVDFDDFTKRIQECKEKLSESIVELQNNYEEIKEEAKQRLGEGYDESAFPHPEALFDKIKIEMTYCPITEDDRRVTSLEDLAKIKREVRAEKRGTENESPIGQNLEEIMVTMAQRNEALAPKKRTRKKSRVEQMVTQAVLDLFSGPEEDDIIEMPPSIVETDDDLNAALDHLSCY